MKTKKRFIAGAKCPQCQQADSLRVWHDNQIEMVECVECDYIEQKSPTAVEQTPRASEQMIGMFKPD